MHNINGEFVADFVFEALNTCLARLSRSRYLNTEIDGSIIVCYQNVFLGTRHFICIASIDSADRVPSEFGVLIQIRLSNLLRSPKKYNLEMNVFFTCFSRLI